MLIYRVTRHTWFGASSEGTRYLTYLSPNRAGDTLVLPTDASAADSCEHHLSGEASHCGAHFSYLIGQYQKRVFGSRDAT